MLSRRLLLSALGSGFLVSAAHADTAPGAEVSTEKTFTEAAFLAAQKAGKPILVEIHAVWCPTCKAQKPILSHLENEPKFAGMVVLRVDFDSMKPLVRKFKAQIQSTLIVYKGPKEVARSVGDTDPTSIEALLSQAI